MLIGHVSDENYVALADVSVEILVGETSVATHSRASGAVYAEVPAGRHEVVLSRDGYAPKRSQVDVAPGRPAMLRMLSDRLVGYAWPKWVRAGESAQLRVHAPDSYRLELWRYGWEKELVAHLGFDPHAPAATRQVTPDGDYTQTGVGWSDPTYAVAPQRSGLYFVHVHTASGGFTAFPWIVSPERPMARIAVLSSSITWNAYNSFGGRSNYIQPKRLTDAPPVNRRQDLERYAHPERERWDAEDYAPLSFDRPEPANTVPLTERITDPVTGRDACALASAEWRLLGWLEREGFPYDLYSDTELHWGSVDLDAYAVLLLNCHPEYWSRDMYDQIKRWVHERGGKVAYLGGNGINCEVELPTRSTMIVRNGDGRVLDADRETLQSRFGMRHEPEANLLGIGYDRSGLMTGAPYRAIDADHWAFAGTGVAAGELFGESCLNTRCPGGASGHEMDKVTRSSPPGVQVLAKGENPDGSGAEIAYYETPSGGAVFSAGSISYVCALPVDDVVSTLTANVLRRFTAVC